MSATDVAAQVSGLAARQWGLVTTAQAETCGITRLQLARLATAGVLERIERGIYAVPAAIDEHTPLRTAWISLAPAQFAEDRISNPRAAGVVSHTSAARLYQLGDLLDDEVEITVETRKQSRRGIRFHRGRLSSEEVTLVEGLPTTTIARTVADLLCDGHEHSHVAPIVGEALKRNLVSQQNMAKALEPLARRNNVADGRALLEYLLDLVGLSTTALMSDAINSELGKALIELGKLRGMLEVSEAFKGIGVFKNSRDLLGSQNSSAFATRIAASTPVAGLLSDIDFSAIINTPAIQSSMTSLRETLPSLIQTIPPVFSETQMQQLRSSISKHFTDEPKASPPTLEAGDPRSESSELEEQQ